MPRNSDGNCIWNYFDKLDDVNKEAECRVCHNVYKYKTTSHNLKLHLKHKHYDVFLNMPNSEKFEKKHTSGPGVWAHFQRLDNENKLATCNACNKVISYRATTANLKSHLRLIHKETYEELLAESDCEEIYLEEALLQVYRENPCLWDMSSELYRNKAMKHAAWVLLTSVLRQLDVDANMSTTKKKVENLRSVYFRELKKVKASRLSATNEDDVYVPNLWYFKLISFLDNDEWGPCRRTSDPLRPADHDSIKLAPQSDEESMESAGMVEPEIEAEAPPKRKWSSRESHTPQKIKLKPEQISIHNSPTFVEPLHYSEIQSFQEPEKPKKINSFGVYVGEQLEQISSFQRDVAEKLISEVLFLAKTGNLNYDSKIETPSKLLNVHTTAYSTCQSPDYNILSPRKIEVQANSETTEETRSHRQTLLKELLKEGKQK